MGGIALQDNTSGNDNVAIGYGTLADNTTASNNTALGREALRLNTTGESNTALGRSCLYNNTTGSNNLAVGGSAMSGGAGVSSYNTAIGRLALSNMTYNGNSFNTAVGNTALYLNTEGRFNTAIGDSALLSNTTADNNTAVGFEALKANTTGTNNTALGYTAGKALTTGNSSVYLGAYAGERVTTGTNSVAIGQAALNFCTTNSNNVAVGQSALYSTTGASNTAIGKGAGSDITTGSKNTIIGAYNGNQGGLDIRTSSNNIVLSDGDGNPRINIDSQGSLMNNNLATPHSQNTVGGAKLYGAGSGSTVLGLLSLARYQGEPLIVNRVNNDGRLIGLQGQGVVRGEIAVSGTTIQYTSYSDHRLKEDVQQISNATDTLKELNPVNFAWIENGVRMNGFLAHEVQSVVPEAVTGTHNEIDADGNPVYQGIDQSKLVPLLVATIKELEARITALEGA